MTQTRNFCFTINNHTDDDIALFKDWNQISYAVYGREVGESGTPHIQGYIELKSPKKFTTLKKFFPRAHLEARKGTAQEASDYCMKDGDFETIGKISHQGNRTDISGSTDLIQQGASMKEVAIYNPTVFVKYHKGLYAFHSILLEPRDEPPVVYVLYGRTGTGKSRQAREITQNPYVWCPQQGQWFDGYEGQDHTIFEEFRGQFPLGMMLSILDRYDCRVQYKGGSIQFRSNKIVITSPVHPREWYQDMANDKVDQLMRRITEIKMLV